ncbi:MAG: sialidase [Proteobacteria bacterium]|nr:sialidase [Pseudomonadota bacterium]
MCTRTAARSWLILVAALGCLTTSATIAAEPRKPGSEPANSQDVDSEKEGAFRFRFVGPRVGNRIAAVAGIAGDPSTYYAGAASGGVWKSIDGGNRWDPIFDTQSAAAIGALAVAPSQPSTVWAGTGEAWAIRDSDVMGNGIYKSTDAGRTWKNMGLPESGRIGRILVHPTNPNIVFACVLGRLTGPQQQRGVFRTTDGGEHWERVLFAGEGVGCSGLSMDAHDPDTLIAGVWQVEMHTWGEYSGGPGSGLYISHDGGTSWKRLEKHGLPNAPLGKIDVAIAPTNSARIYALIQTRDQGSVWRSDNAGKDWKRVNSDRSLIGRAGYYIRIAVSTGSDNEVLVASSSFHQSLDAGESFRNVPWGGDTHDIWIDPRDPDRFVITDDGGMIITTVHGRGFHRVTLPIGQMYHVAVDEQVPYYFYSNMQDDGNMRGPSVPVDSQETGWDRHMGGCESGFTIPDVVDPNVVWATCYGDTVTRWDARHREAHSVSPWKHTLDHPPNVLKYRCHWTPPLAIDPFDHNTVYYGCQVIFRTSDAGQTWAVVSPDLSTQDPAHIAPSGGIVGDNLGQFYGEVVFAIAPSKIQKGLIWAGTNDGQVWYTKDAAANWVNVTSGMKGLPAGGTITSIAPSSFDAGTAYVAVDFHLVNDRDPYIYKTTDFGKSWKRISSDLPRGELSYVRTVTDDPNCPGLLFAGTGNALHYSLDDGAHWMALRTGLPPAPVTWAVVQKEFHDLVVATYGRGLYILDDITPLEQMARQRARAPVGLFEPRKTYRFVKGGAAMVNFFLDTVPREPVKLEIVDSKGASVRTLEAKDLVPGINRIQWDLRYESPRLVALRTVAPDNPRIWLEPRFWEEDSRAITHWGSRPAEVGPIVAPGVYTLRLTAASRSYEQPLTVVADPRAPGSAADIESSVGTLLRIRDDISHVADSINRMEWMRKQLEVIQSMLQTGAPHRKPETGFGEDDDDEDAEPAAAPPRLLSAAEEQQRAQLLQAAQDLDKKLEAVESRLVSRALRDSDDKYFVEAYGAYLDLIWLNAEVGTGGGDVAGGADFAPTAAQLATLTALEGEMAHAEADFQAILQQELPAFNQSLERANMIPLAGVSGG